MRALRNHSRAVYGDGNDSEKLSVLPAPLPLKHCPDLALVAEIHPVRERFFAGLELPASTLFKVSALAEPELMLEIDLVIMLPL